MLSSDQHKSPLIDELSNWERWVLWGLLAAVAVLHLFMVWRFEVNWDEFYRLGRIYEWKEGRLTAVLQTNYVYFFGWLEAVHENEVYQIIAARGVIYLLLIACCANMFLLMRYLFDDRSALIALIAFLSFSFVFRHATSFRVDVPILALVLTTISCLVLTSRRGLHFVIGGFCLGLAGSFSLKAVLFVPTITGLLLLYWAQSRWNWKVFLCSVSLGVTALLTFLTLIFLHDLALPNATVEEGFDLYVVNTAILGYGLFPQLQTLLTAIGQNLLYVMLFIAGVGYTVFRFVQGQDRQKAALIFIIGLLPMIALVIYVHTYAYYYTTLLATGSILIACAVHHLGKLHRQVSVLIAFLIVVSSAPIMIKSFKQTHDYQVQIASVIHDMFPEPVSYVDRCSQISSFPKQGLFMSRLTMDEYKLSGKPFMAEIFASSPPEFVLGNIPGLDLESESRLQSTRRLLPEDERLLTEHFIHHWGPIYVPGKSFAQKGQVEDFRIDLEGLYTVESASDVIIDGKSYSPMTSLFLKKGDHVLDLRSNQTVTLRWGQNLYRPDVEPLGDIVFRGF